MTTTTRREVFFLIGPEHRVLWSDTTESPLALTDKRARWEAIWSHRDTLVELCHSHPVGPDGFSAEDATTMEALDAGLGKSLRFSLVTPNGYFVRAGKVDVERAAPPPWVQALRAESGMRNVRPWLDAQSDRPELEALVDALRRCPQLVFVCTHNSRRSQLAEALARALAREAGQSRWTFFSAGTEATALAEPARAALERLGVDWTGLSSKTLKHASLPKTDFAAVMVCSDADRGCPFVPGATARVSLPFVDPKRSDGSAEEAATYDATAEEIGRVLGAAIRAAK